MVILDRLFGGDKQKAPAITVKAPAEADGLPPEVVAAISAGVVRAAIMAAVAATVVHVHGSPPVVRIKRTSNIWVTAGRLQLMGSRRI